MEIASTDPNPSVPTTLRCVRCGYDLRSQTFDGLCPECGLSVELAVLTTDFLFWLWSTYLLCRFAIVFHKSASIARRNWIASDAAIKC